MNEQPGIVLVPDVSNILADVAKKFRRQDATFIDSAWREIVSDLKLTYSDGH